VRDNEEAKKLLQASNLAESLTAATLETASNEHEARVGAALTVA
jgi:hypothetical protein